MIRRQVEVPVSPDRVWEAITDPDELAGWFGAQVEWDLSEGAPASFRTDDGEDLIGAVVSVRPGRHLRFVWTPADGSAPTSEVTYLIEPLEDGSRSRLTVTEKQVPPTSAPAASASWTPWDTRLAGAWVAMRAGAPVHA